MNMFRELRADEIDCRIAQIKEKQGKPTGLSLLLYKDARCDQNILDETVGPMNWQREHTRDNRNCIVSIWDDTKGQWISKEDTGVESYTEKEKGLASDSFKRACFNWGIGRELYTSPFIWIPADKCAIVEYKGKWACFDRFTVAGIGYTDGVITGLKIKNQASSRIVYDWGVIEEEAPDKPEDPEAEPSVDPPADVTVTDKIPFDYKPVFKRIKENLKITDKDFAGLRKELIKRNKIDDIPGVELDEDGWKKLEKAMTDLVGEKNGVSGKA